MNEKFTKPFNILHQSYLKRSHVKGQNLSAKYHQFHKTITMWYQSATNRAVFVKFHHEINILKSILYKNSYPRDFVDKCIKQFLERVLTRKVIGSTVPTKDMMITLTFMAKLSLQICTRFNRVMKNKVLHCNF